MSFPKTLENCRGSWKGTSTLHLSWLPEDQKLSTSDSRMEIGDTANGLFALITYTWEHEGKPQSGTILIGEGESGSLESAWVDSWHQNPGILYSKGQSDDRVSVEGTYDGGDGSIWGWRIEVLTPDRDTCRVEMTNITPDGDEEWAVRGEYERSK